MAKSVKAKLKTTAKVTPKATPRKRKAPHYRSFRLTPKIKYTGPKLQNSFKIFGGAMQHLWRNWKLFGFILFFYIALNIVLVRGFGGGLHLNEVKQNLDDLLGGTSRWSTGLALFGYLVGSSNSATSEVAGVYQLGLVLMTSLALIWALRRSYDATQQQKVIKRDAFYKGMSPMIPFILVLLVIGLQLLPVIIGSTIYSVVINNGIAVTMLEKVIWGLIWFLTGLLSLYMVSSSIFALYIVTLPDMTPLKALRSARQLVLYRRWSVLRKVIFLPAALVVLAVAIILPLVLFLTSIAEWVFFVYGIVALAVLHSYMYRLYRELL